LGRAMRYVHAIQKMVFSVHHALSTLFWAVVLLFGVVFVVAVSITQSVVDEVIEPQRMGAVLSEEALSLIPMYGSIGKSTICLLKSVLGGVDWGDAYDPLLVLGFMPPVLFLVFVLFVMICLLNVVASVILESALEVSKIDRDLAIYEEERNLEILKGHVCHVFHKVDADHSGAVNEQELMHFLTDDLCCTYFDALGINPSEVSSLFALMDLDDSGEVNLEEFLDGCKRLKGEARSYDIHCIIFETRKMKNKLDRFMTFTEKYLDAIMLTLGQQEDGQVIQDLRAQFETMFAASEVHKPDDRC